MKTFVLEQFGSEHLKCVDRDLAKPSARQVTVKFHAASLNYRDLMFVRGHYNPKARLPAIPLSDGAGEVVEAGAEVVRWRVGDRVCPIFVQDWIEGEPSAEKAASALGAGERDGVLREFGTFDERSLVRIPGHLSYEEAATLPCAAVTAWNALVASGGVKAGDTVLTLGTGGVSTFALQLAKLHGARVLVTSSSDDKLARAKALGADELINYRTTPDWEREVLKRTDGIGVDHVVELGGAGTLNKSLKAVRIGGRVALIGVLAAGGDFDPVRILMKHVCVQGIFVGSRAMFEAMNRAVAEAGIRPVLDRVFDFGEAPAAFDYMAAAGHFGKIVIRY